MVPRILFTSQGSENRVVFLQDQMMSTKTQFINYLTTNALFFYCRICSLTIVGGDVTSIIDCRSMNQAVAEIASSLKQGGFFTSTNPAKFLNT